MISHRNLLVELNARRPPAEQGQGTEQFLERILATPTEGVAAEHQPFVAAVKDVDTALLELEAMQFILAERYPGQRFARPGED